MSEFDADIQDTLPSSSADTVITGGRRVAIVTPTLRKIGGTEVYVWRLIRVLREMGIRVAAFTQDGPPGEVETDGVMEYRCGDVLSESLWPAAWKQRAPAVAELADKIAKSADVVNFHRLAPLDLLRKLKGRVPIALSVHTTELTCPSGGRYLPKSARACERTPGFGCLVSHLGEGCLCTPDGKPFPLRQKLRALKKRGVSTEIAEIADVMFFNSNALMNNFRTHIAHPRAFKVISPPLETIAADGAREADLMLYVGRLETNKGVFEALEVLKRLPGTRLEFYGEGGARADLEARISFDKLGERATIKGWVDNKALAIAYARASCVLVPSLLFESFGMSGIEAISHGCPAVAYDVGGTREWCSPTYGTLVPQGDVQGLAVAAARWLERMKAGLDTSTWGKSARRRWGGERFARDYVLAVEDLLSGHDA
ncbi:MAG: glycosyltransferase family 4 protein [Planctomycetes bacterium]|nr:glycosyltransferase family 4 protein [Planctomycetota bacterium]